MDKQHKCEEDLVTVEQQPEVAATISVLQVGCAYDLSEADVTIEIKSANGKPITEYEIRALKSADSDVAAYKRILVHTTESGNGALAYRDIVAVMLDRGFLSKRVTKIKLSIEAVTFSDGTGWRARMNK